MKLNCYLKMSGQHLILGTYCPGGSPSSCAGALGTPGAVVSVPRVDGAAPSSELRVQEQLRLSHVVNHCGESAQHNEDGQVRFPHLHSSRSEIKAL